MDKLILTPKEAKLLAEELMPKNFIELSDPIRSGLLAKLSEIVVIKEI